MPYSEQFNDAQLVYDSADGKAWKPRKFKSGYGYAYLNRYVAWLISHNASFVVRITTKGTFLIKSDIHERLL